MIVLVVDCQDENLEFSIKQLIMVDISSGLNHAHWVNMWTTRGNFQPPSHPECWTRSQAQPNE